MAALDTAPLLSHRLWMEGPEAYSRLPRGRAFVFLVVAIYFLGFAAAAPGGIAIAYLVSPAFVLGSVGIAWVFSSVPARARRVDRLYSDALNAFDDDPHAIAREIRKRFDVACDWRGHLAASALLAFVFVVAAYFGFFQQETVSLPSLRPVWFSDTIYDAGLGVPGFTVVVLFAILISASLGSSAWLLAMEIRILPYLADRNVPPLPEALRSKLRGVADFHVLVARDWSAGTFLLILLFAAQPDIASIIFVTAAVISAMVIFIVPQAYLRRVILRAHRRAVDIALEEWRDQPKTPRGRKQAELVATLSEATVAPNYWVYGSGALTMWLAAQLIALGALGLQLWTFWNDQSGGAG